MIGERLKELRIKRNLTIAQTAEALGMNANTYAKYERNERDVSTEGLCRIAEFYKVSADYLLGRAPQTNPFAMLDLQVDIGEEAVMGQYMQLPKEWRRILLEVMKQLGDAAERGERGGRIKKQPNPYLIKLHQNKASAGFGYDLASEDEWDEIEIAATPQAIAADFAVEVDGDSMEPDFHDGDIALVRFDPDVPVGKVGLFVLDGMGYIKERGKKCLISRNPAYEDLKLDDSARCIGLVIGIAETV
jgi:transcriptional regulator with XRE-family HTH domain